MSEVFLLSGETVCWFSQMHYNVLCMICAAENPKDFQSLQIVCLKIEFLFEVHAQA